MSVCLLKRRFARLQWWWEMMGDDGRWEWMLHWGFSFLTHVRCSIIASWILSLHFAQCLTLYLSDPVQVASSRQAGRQHPDWWTSDPSSGAGPGQMGINAGPRIKGRGEVCNPLSRQGMWHVLHVGAGGYSLPRQGFVTGWVRGMPALWRKGWWMVKRWVGGCSHGRVCEIKAWLRRCDVGEGQG